MFTRNISVLGALAAAMLASTAALAQVSDDVVKIGVLTDMNGPASTPTGLMLVQVKSPEESKYPWDYYKILAKISGDEAFGPPDAACPLVKK